MTRSRLNQGLLLWRDDQVYRGDPLFWLGFSLTFSKRFKGTRDSSGKVIRGDEAYVKTILANARRTYRYTFNGRRCPDNLESLIRKSLEDIPTSGGNDRVKCYRNFSKCEDNEIRTGYIKVPGYRNPGNSYAKCTVTYDAVLLSGKTEKRQHDLDGSKGGLNITSEKNRVKAMARQFKQMLSHRLCR